jgi:hypothetical protein
LTESTEKLNRVLLRELHRSVCAVRKNGTQPEKGLLETPVTKLKPVWGNAGTFVALGSIAAEIAETGFREHSEKNACCLSAPVDTGYVLNQCGVTQQHVHGETHRAGDRAE